MKKIDYIEIAVNNLSLAVDFYQQVFQFKPIAYFENKDISSVLMKLHAIKIILTHHQHNNVIDFIHPQQQIVTKIAFEVDHLESILTSNDIALIQEPTLFTQNGNTLRQATVKTFGHVNHVLIERKNESPYFIPGFIPLHEDCFHENDNAISTIDHLAICVEQGDLQKWKTHYQDVYGFHQSYSDYVSTEYSSMNSLVMQSPNDTIKLVFVEPGEGKRQSQVADYLKTYHGPCVQHIAFSTHDIIKTVKKLRQAGMDFLNIPNQYYIIQKEKLKNSNLDFQLFQEQSILVDKDESGYLYQTFTKTSESKPILFFEMIQRINSNGFGNGNIRALFQAIEQEQMNRDTANY